MKIYYYKIGFGSCFTLQINLYVQPYQFLFFVCVCGERERENVFVCVCMVCVYMFVKTDIRQKERISNVTCCDKDQF